MNVTIEVPALHPVQREVDTAAARFRVICAGRRFGKSILSMRRILRVAASGRPTAYFAPTYKMLADYWREATALMLPLLEKMNVQEKRLQLLGGGAVDFWSLDEPNSARGRKYAHIAIDEAATVPQLQDAWQAVLRPTLADFEGTADFYSTPRGRGFFYECFQRGKDPLYPEWQSWQFPTAANPYISPAEIEAARKDLPERTFAQEFEATFLEDSGGVFRGVRDAVETGRTQPLPPEPGRVYWLGVDLARIEDFTVLAVLDAEGRQAYFERFNQISWERQIEAICRAATRYNAQVVLDSTGVGDPIFEALRKRGLRITPFRFTSASKEPLIDNLALKIEQASVKLMDVPTQTAELEAYEYEITASGNTRMNAPSGSHDDCVIALALAAWGLRPAASRRMVTF